MPEPKPKHARPGRPRDEELPARRRTEIVRHAIEEFARRGFNGADLDVIAANAGCSKGTLYNYFKSKSELFEASVDAVMFRPVEDVGQADEGDAVELLEKLVYDFLRHFAEHPQYVELLVQERSDFRDREGQTYTRYVQAKRQKWMRRFAEMTAAGRMRPMPPERAMNFLADVLYGTIFLNHFRGRKTDPATQAADLCDVLFGGLLTPKALAERAKRLN